MYKVTSTRDGTTVTLATDIPNHYAALRIMGVYEDFQLIHKRLYNDYRAGLLGVEKVNIPQSPAPVALNAWAVIGVTLNAWSVIGSAISLYSPPEAAFKRLSGIVSGHPTTRLNDGRSVHTSRIVKIDGRLITTRTGTVYELGVVHKDYAVWCLNASAIYGPNPLGPPTEL